MADTLTPSSAPGAHATSDEAAAPETVAGRLQPPSKLADLDRILDLYYIEPTKGGPVLNAEWTGGQGAYCFYGPPMRADLRGTELANYADRLYEEVKQRFPQDEEFIIEFEGRVWRGARDSNNLTTEIGFRRMPNDVPRLADLSFDQHLTPSLLEGTWLNDGGIVVLCGLNGQGKTTCAGATVRSRLERFGGRAVTVEDLLELPLENRFGSGVCRQLRVSYEGKDSWRRGFAGTLRRAYRKLPVGRSAILFIGEVRDTETAAEVVKAGVNGMLVVTTLHASDPIAAVNRLVSLAEQDLGETASTLVAQALRMVVHHKLVLSAQSDLGWKRGQFYATHLVSDSSIHPVANAIRSRRYEQLNQVMSYQQSVARNAMRQQMTGSQYLAEIGHMAPAMRRYTDEHGPKA